MKRYLFDNFNLFTFFSIIILYISLLIGFYYNENSTGGAFTDYYGHKQISISFANDFLNTFLNFDKTQTRHSPVIIILFSFFEKFQVNDFLIRLINLHICLILPVIFYKCLKIKFNDINQKYLILLSGLIFLSPTFRSLSIWPDSRIWGLLFFCLSIHYFLLYKNDKNFRYCVYVVFFYSISSYLSPNFSVFSIYFMFYFFKDLNLKKVVSLLILNLVLSIPAFYYIFILDINFLFSATAAPGGSEDADNNVFNKILIISSIIVFYMIPFLVSKSININFKKINIVNFIFLFILFSISTYFYNYKFEYTGGGIFFKLSTFLFDNNLFFFIVVLVSLILNYLIFSASINNLLIILLLILNNPQLTIYHKYYDPFLLILFLTLFDLDFLKKKLFSQRSIYIFYLFSIFFLLLSISKSYV